MSKILVTFKSNWADEIDIKESQLFDETEWDSWVEEMPEKFTLMFGTNQDAEYTKGSYLRCITKTPLSDEQHDVLYSFQSTLLGYVPFPDW